MAKTITRYGRCWIGRDTIWQFGRLWRGPWAQLQWLPLRWNIGIGVVVGNGDVGFYVRLGPVWIDGGWGSQRAQ